MLWRLIKLLFWLALLGAIALVAYAYIGPVFFPDDFAPPREEIIIPLILEPGE